MPLTRRASDTLGDWTMDRDLTLQKAYHLQRVEESMQIEKMTEFETAEAAREEVESIAQYLGPKAAMSGHRDYNHVLARLNMATCLLLAAQKKRFDDKTPCHDD